jgi:alkylation response protein AidB-like acyl-CoA dehydrogenase
MAEVSIKTPLQIVVVNDGLILIENRIGTTVITATPVEGGSGYIISDARSGEDLTPAKESDETAVNLDEAAHKMVDKAVRVLPGSGYSCTVPIGVLDV